MEKIIASPQYGRLFSPALKLILVLGMCFALLILVYSIALIVLLIIGLLDYTNGIITASIILDMLGLLLFFWDLRLLLRNAKLKRNLIKWQNDFVKIFASVNIVIQGDKIFKDYMVTAKFEYNGIQCEKKKRAGNYLTGYDRILKKYVGSKIPIYYSPTYDEFVFIKKD